MRYNPEYMNPSMQGWQSIETMYEGYTFIADDTLAARGIAYVYTDPVRGIEVEMYIQ